MTWKDDYEAEKKESGLTWQEFHNERFIHVDELSDFRDEIDELKDQVEAMTREYRGLKREFHELKVMLESDEFDP